MVSSLPSQVPYLAIPSYNAWRVEADADGYEWQAI